VKHDYYAAQWGLCVADDVELCQQETHDRLIDGLGSQRRSGVFWFIWTPSEAMLECARVGTAIPADVVERIGDYPDCRVVLALAAHS